MAILVQSNKKPSVSFPSQTGSIVTFNSQYAGLPLKSHKIALTATQSGSGTPSPDNVRPISGHNTINISHSGADTSSPITHIITIGSTVYGGEYDARTGVLTAESTILTINNFASNYWRSLGLGVGCLVRGLGSDVYNASYISNMNTICNYFKKRDAYTWNLSDGEFNVADGFIAFRSDENFNDVSSVISYFQTLYNNGTPAQFIVKLATPQTIQLQPCPIDTLQGENNLFASTGETTADYIKIGG